MKKLFINSETQIYVACPANIASGGPELLHQLVYELTNLGLSAYMFYYFYNNAQRNRYPTHKEYINYGNKFVNSIEDNKSNILIVPEVRTDLIYNYKDIQKVIWWLSVDNYFKFLKSKNVLEKLVKNILYTINFYPTKKIYRFNKKENVLHFVQSKYAEQFLKSKGLESFYLSDYLSPIFFQQNEQVKKENIVAYNPRKGTLFTRAIIDAAKTIQFIPIKNMTKEGVSRLLSTAKVYIDFGEHPGKDRIPREAAISGCCVITGKRGSAAYQEDVPIPEAYKFKDKKGNIPRIIEKIKECLYDYENRSKDFENYREIIKNERTKFIMDLKKIFQIGS